jgi:hypothetical protein
MRKVKIIGVILVAVLALGALASASASAAPEWFKGNPAVVVKAGEKVQFTGKAGAGVLEAEGGHGTVKCTGDTSKGEIEGPSTVEHVVVTDTGCVKGAKKCTSPGAGSGTIRTNDMTGVNIWLDHLHTKAGILFTPSVTVPFVTFTCQGEVEEEVTGELIGEAKPVSGMPANTGTLTFAQEKGTQRWLMNEETGVLHDLKAFGLVQSGVGGGEKVAETLVETVTYSIGASISLK